MFWCNLVPFVKIQEIRWNKKQVLPRANGWGFGSIFFGNDLSLLHNNLENEAMVENVAGTTFDRIAPTRDLFLSSESLY